MIEHYIDDNDLESTLSPCLWKITIEENKRGIGTSFDPGNLTELARKCYYCQDFYQGSVCEGYVSED